MELHKNTKLSNDLEHLNLWHFEISVDNQNIYSLSGWDLISNSKIILQISVVIVVTGNAEVRTTSKYWTIDREVKHIIGTHVLLYEHLFHPNFIWWNLKWEQESFIRLAITMNKCPWFIRKSTKYEATSTPNHCNGRTLVVTLGMKIWCLSSIPWSPIQELQISRYPILWQPTPNLIDLMFGQNIWFDLTYL